jgi:hypothetical protein
LKINYSKYYPWKEPTTFKVDILKGSKIHTIRRKVWGIKQGCALSHGKKIGGAGYKREEFLINTCTAIQKVELIFNKIKIIAALVDQKKVDWREIAKNDGLTEDQFSRWFYTYQENGIFKGFIIHWTNLKY